MVKVLRNLGRIYAYCYKWGNDSTKLSNISLRTLSYKRRKITDPNEIILDCEIIGINDDDKDHDDYTDSRELALKSMGFDIKSHEIYGALAFVKEKDVKVGSCGIETVVVNGSIYYKYALIIDGKELERSDKDNEQITKFINEEAERQANKVFVEDSVNAVLSKYGMKFNALNHEVSWDNDNLSNLIIDYLNNTMIKELKEIGVDAELNTNILGQYSGHPLLNVPIYKRKFKINLKSEGE